MRFIRIRIRYHSALLSIWNRIATRAELIADRHYASRSRLICRTVPRLRNLSR